MRTIPTRKKSGRHLRKPQEEEQSSRSCAWRRWRSATEGQRTPTLSSPKSSAQPGDNRINDARRELQPKDSTQHVLGMNGLTSHLLKHISSHLNSLSRNTFNLSFCLAHLITTDTVSAYF
ncbi:Hypothetical predicted protein [Podarcis lilfordi]|uniref:Uncharacterized protein n=1 Tax=Podarcis lilfordi TaxID=74358 RepID=A0AA35PPA8_9SAUR|nr:Hypothetical predicted protein [Podarcis lilfordi]